MYGKIFEALYEGSMVGAGATVFAVWGYCIAKADPDTHEVRLNPSILATAIGESEKKIASAVEFLCSPDTNSTNTDHEGRRLLHSSGFTYLVVSHSHYREIKTSRDKREYERERKRQYRLKKDGIEETVPECPKCPGHDGTPASVYVSVYGEGESGGGRPESNRFIKPTLEEVTVYISEIKAGINPQEFLDANDAKGWLVGTTKTPMKDWKAVVRTWKRHRKNGGTQQQLPSTWSSDTLDPTMKGSF